MLQRTLAVARRILLEQARQPRNLFFWGLFPALQTLMVFATAWPLVARYQGSVALGALVVLLSVFSYVGIGFVLAARFARRLLATEAGA